MRDLFSWLRWFWSVATYQADEVEDAIDAAMVLAHLDFRGQAARRFRTDLGGGESC